MLHLAEDADRMLHQAHAKAGLVREAPFSKRPVEKQSAVLRREACLYRRDRTIGNRTAQADAAFARVEMASMGRGVEVVQVARAKTPGAETVDRELAVLELDRTRLQ